MARLGDNRPDQFAVVGLLKKTPTDMEILKKSVVHDKAQLNRRSTTVAVIGGNRGEKGGSRHHQSWKLI